MECEICVRKEGGCMYGWMDEQMDGGGVWEAWKGWVGGWNAGGWLGDEVGEECVTGYRFGMGCSHELNFVF